ncbi:hypothetical protein LZ31DRAFT_43915 [Colletotrichum somersetense]|nr:hypothetical protein LZ31DRAFT_43915 [Colletotrichum somersetense]
MGLWTLNTALKRGQPSLGCPSVALPAVPALTDKQYPAQAIDCQCGGRLEVAPFPESVETCIFPTYLPIVLRAGPQNCENVGLSQSLNRPRRVERGLDERHFPATSSFDLNIKNHLTYWRTLQGSVESRLTAYPSAACMHMRTEKGKKQTCIGSLGADEEHHNLSMR